ncbi:MAG TPA: glycosyltransferase family 39 protein [Coleofasciculaceae cyanobacterium]
MISKVASFWTIPSKWLRLFVITLLVIGVFFRFINLDRKVYWHDEAFTSMRISGYSKQDVQRTLFDGRVITVEDIQKYQRPNSEKNLTDTINVLSQYSEHPPLYYLMARFWAQWFGASVAVMRTLPALISLLTFPCIYWLCRELFGSSHTGWIAMALVAVSPMHVLYAQEARQYSLWTVAILLSSVAFLRAVRLNSKLSWGIYTATLTIGLYSNLLFALAAIGHGIYLLVTIKYRRRNAIAPYLIASLATLITFIPWILVIINNVLRIQRWTSVSPERHLFKELLSLLKWWLRNLNNIFFDLDASLHFFDPLTYDDPFLITPVLILLGYSLYFLYRQTPRVVSLFVLTWIGATALPLILADISLGGGRSTAVRYLIPAYLGIQIAVAHLLATKISLISVPIQQQTVWKLVTLVVVSGGILSCTISSSAEAWWNKFVDPYNPQAARVINQASAPLVVSDTPIPGSVLSLSHLLSPNVRFQLVMQPIMLKLSDNFSEVFLFECSSALREKIEKEEGYQFKVAFKGYKFELWKAEKP